MGSRTVDLSGQRFDRLIAICPMGGGGIGKHIIWLCRCDCGNLCKTESSNLKRGYVKSCGCWKRDQAKKCGENNFHYKHGDAHPKTRLYGIWAGMIGRCYYPKNDSYRYYGKRGIQVCLEWKNDYSSFKKWALSNGYQNNLTIDRINNNGHYEPSNCQWLTRAENARKGNRQRGY